VRATSFPSIRARNTSPALTCRSDAPRSIAALMICSMPRGWPAVALARTLLPFSSVTQYPASRSTVLVSGDPARAPDVLHDQPRLALPEACRHGGDMGAHKYARVAPEG